MSSDINLTNPGLDPESQRRAILQLNILVREIFETLEGPPMLNGNSQEVTNPNGEIIRIVSS